MHELMFQAGVKGMSERSELIPCKLYTLVVLIIIIATALFNRGAGKGPILLARVACNNCHSNLSQCVHPNDIGIHDCNRDNTAGVICSIPLQNNTVNVLSKDLIKMT